MNRRSPWIVLVAALGFALPAWADLSSDLAAFDRDLAAGTLSPDAVRSRSNEFLRQWGEIEALERREAVPEGAARQIYDHREAVVAQCKTLAARFVLRNGSSRNGGRPWTSEQVYGILNTGSWVRDKSPSFRKDVDFTLGTAPGAEQSYYDFKESFERYFQRMTGADAEGAKVGVLPKDSIPVPGAAGGGTNQYRGGARRFVDIYSVGYGSAERILPDGGIRAGYRADDFFLWANESMPRMDDADGPGLAGTMWEKYQKLEHEFAGEARAREVAKVISRSHYAKRVVLHERAGSPMGVAECAQIERGANLRQALSKRMRWYRLSFQQALEQHLAEGRELVRQNAENLSAPYTFPDRGSRPSIGGADPSARRRSRYEDEPSLRFDREKFIEKLRDFVKQKLKEAIERRLREIQDAVVDEVHRQVDGIYRQILDSTDIDEAVREFGGDVERAIDDFLDNHETVRLLYQAYTDQRSWEIMEGLGSRWERAKGELEKILGAKREIDAAPPDADTAKILRDWGVSGAMLDRFERYETQIRGAIADHADHLSAFKILYNGFEGTEPGGPILALFTIMENYGSRVPVLGAFIEAYGTIGKGVLEAALALGRRIRERAGG
ncbi:MAG: hypothetical protein HY608_10250 [Planctomycetes bacterium]|nr:hypothetical protein [Planctomycetota bacterium]